jgi:hypothetical protein
VVADEEEIEEEGDIHRVLLKVMSMNLAMVIEEEEEEDTVAVVVTEEGLKSS